MTREEMEAGVLGYFDAVGKGDRAHLLELFQERVHGPYSLMTVPCRTL